MRRMSEYKRRKWKHSQLINLTAFRVSYVWYETCCNIDFFKVES